MMRLDQLRNGYPYAALSYFVNYHIKANQIGVMVIESHSWASVVTSNGSLLPYGKALRALYKKNYEPYYFMTPTG